MTFFHYIEYSVTNVCFKSKIRKKNYEESHCNKNFNVKIILSSNEIVECS